jgi:sugar phosphate isomerase/epimerase
MAIDISLVTDELSADPRTAFELGSEWGIHRYELRGFYSDRVPQISRHQRHQLRQLISDFDAKITAVSPGLFKFAYPDEKPAASNLGWMDHSLFAQWDSQVHALHNHMENLLPASIELAQEVDAPFIIAFSFHRGGAAGGPAPERVIEALGQAAARVRAAGLTLLIETEEGFWADTGARTAALIEAVGDSGIAVNWDPANSFCEGDIPYPSGYAAVRSHVRNVHFKDAMRSADGRAEFVGEGQVDWSGQIAALRRDDYGGCIAIEPHLQPRVASVRHALERLRKLLNAAS